MLTPSTNIEPLVGFLVFVDEPDEGGLAGTAGSDQEYKVAIVDLQGDVVQCKGAGGRRT